MADHLRQAIDQRQADTELLSHRTAVNEMRVMLQNFSMELRTISRMYTGNEIVQLGASQLLNSIGLVERELSRSLRHGGGEEEE